MAEKGETSDGGDSGVKGVSANRRDASSPRQRSGRRTSRRPWRASAPQRSPSPPRFTKKTPVSCLPMRASTPRRSISPRGCATAPVRRVSPPRSRGRSGLSEKDYAQYVPPPLFCVSPQRCANSPIRRVFPPRRLNFDEKGSYMGKEAATSKVDNESKSFSARQMQLNFDGKGSYMGKEAATSEVDNESKSFSARKMMSPLEASRSSKFSGNKRSCRTNPKVDSIWKKTCTSSRPMLGTLCLDLASGSFHPKKQYSYKTVNSKESDNESETNYKTDIPPSKPIVACALSCSNHKLYLCPCEMKTSQKITADIPMTEKKEIPGGNDEAEFLIRKSSNIVRRMIKAVTGSHDRDVCFKGNLSLENFMMTKEGDVKLTGVEPCGLSITGAELDDKKLADIIQHELFADREIPPSIDELLKLLRTGERGQESAMANSISLMSEMERMSLFEWMFKTLQKLKKADPMAYRGIKLRLEAHSCWHDWKSRAKKNVHLSKILNYIDPVTQKPVEYPETVEGLLQFTRNSIEHLPKHSYDYTTQSSLYYLFEIDYILSGTFRGLFEVLQRVMSASGKLCHWE